MTRPRSTTIKTVRELVQQQRGELYATGHRNLNMSLSAETIERIDALKTRFGLRSRDAVVARIIRKCMMTTDPDTFTQRAAGPDTIYRRISPIVAGELADFVKRVQLRFRGLAYGPVFEMILAEVGTDFPESQAPADRLAGEFSARKHEAASVAEAA
jgi:hypothetical protein